MPLGVAQQWQPGAMPQGGPLTGDLQGWPQQSWAPAPRPSRGRSPQAQRGRQGPLGPQGRPKSPDRDWATLRAPRPAPAPERTRQLPDLGLPEFGKGKGGPGGPAPLPMGQPPQAEFGEKGAGRDLGPTQMSQEIPPARQQEPWRPTFKPSLMDEPFRRLPSTDRRHSAERAERRFSAERRLQSPPRGGKGKGPLTSIAFDRSLQKGVQQSDWWTHSLHSGGNAHVSLVADASALGQAAHRLNFLGPETLAAVDCQGVGLHTAAGKICILQVAFRHGVTLEVFLFDVAQLGEQVQVLLPFLQNARASKLIHNAQQYATVLAQQFGLTLAGVIDANWAYETLHGKPLGCLSDLLDWCGVLPLNVKEEALRIERNPELWAHRPLARNVLMYAVQSICTLHSAVPVLWSRLTDALGPSVFDVADTASRQRVEVAAAAGWACRQAGLWTAEHIYPQAPNPGFPEPDPELNDWLAKRFGANSSTTPAPSSSPAAGGGTGNAARGQGPALPSVARRAQSQEPLASATAVVRADDSPRTASWRAAMAQLGPQAQNRAFSARQRSSSPCLETWLARRSEIKAAEPALKPPRRASSLPPRGTGMDSSGPQFAQPPLEQFGIGFQQMSEYTALDRDQRPWAEILEEEQAQEAEESRRCEEDLFEELQQEERRRLAQSELP